MVIMNSTEKGKRGEDLAALYLEHEGYQIIARNFKALHGEIDIIAEMRDDIVFFEVKTWNSYASDGLEYAVDQKKRNKIIQASKTFLKQNERYENRPIRFDVLYVAGTIRTIEHYEDVFTESGVI